MMRATRPLLALAGSLAIGACAHSPPTTMLTLDAVAPSVEGEGTGYRGLPIAVPALHVPALLDRPEFVHQVGAGEVRVEDFARWAAPFGLLARDALVRDLTARLPAGSVLPPGAGGGPGSRVLDITLLALDMRAGNATMAVAYRTLPGGRVRQLALSVPAPASGDGPAATAQALAALLGQLADAIVADLAAPRAARP